MKLWKQLNTQRYEDIDYFDTRKGFQAEVFAMRLY